ncbi:MFS transporter [Candidatus Pacearchaeota archaeon]|nr:MFS transporter [Candidatus Pacearchaeota archaeon]
MKKRIVNLYLVIVFLFNLGHSFFFATYVVFLVSKGLDLFQVSLINCFFMAGVFFLEMPTGAFADLMGRKRTFVISCFIYSLSMFIYYFSETFWIFVLAESIASLASALHSGSFEAWIVDSLKYYGFDENEDIDEVFRKGNQIKPFGIIIGSLIGGYIGINNLALPWLFSSISMAFVGIFAYLTMKEEYVLKKTREFKITDMFSDIKQIIIESIHYGIKKRSVFYIICFNVIFMFIIQSLNMYWQIMFKNFGLNTDKLSWIFIGIAGFTSLGSYLSKWFRSISRNEKEAIVLSQLITVIGILIASQCNMVMLILYSFLFHEIGRGMFQPLSQSYINKRIPSKQRATILSFDSMITKGGAVFGLIIGGWLAKNYSISTSWFVSGIVLLIAIPIFFKMENGE